MSNANPDEPTIAYFGYGSLVNLDTLRTPYVAAYPATLKGWRRTWLSRPAVSGSFAPEEGLAFLSVEPNATSEIDGVIIVDHAASLPSLDEREALYERQSLERSEVVIHREPSALSQESQMFLYVAEPFESTPTHNPKILRSYLDAVSQGFHHHFGEAGLQRFRDTTNNFHYPIKEDRSAPLYPRAVTLNEAERSRIDVLFPVSAQPK